MSELPPIPDEEQLSPCVARIIGRNPSSFTLQGTNTYLVGDPRQKYRVLIDTASGFEQYTNHLRRYLTMHGLEISAIVITHWHPDHYGGLEEVRKIAPRARLYKYKIKSPYVHDEPWPFIHWADEQVIEEAGVHLKAYFTPGHCDDHISIWLEEEAVLFSGDNLLGHGSSVFKDYTAYINSLIRMRDIPNLGLVYPGHGIPIKNGIMGFNNNIEHRYQREHEVLHELKTGGALTDEEIVARIYKDLQGRPKKIKLGALSNTHNYLAKLEADGKVLLDGDKWKARI